MCPSCWARRAADTASDLPSRVGRLLPDVPYRPWVLTFPWALCFRLACDRALLSRMLRVFLRTLFAWQRRRGGALGGAGTPCAQTGSVTFVQRFTQDLRLFPHVHVVVPDGLFTLPDGGTELRFHALPPPTDSDVRALTERLAEHLQTAALRHGTPPTLTDGEEGDAEDALVRSCAAAALRRPPAKPDPGPPRHPAPPKPRRRLSWAALLLRTLDVDALTCARCAPPMVVLAFLTDPRVVWRTLAHLGLPTAPPSLAKPRQEEPPAHDRPSWSDDPDRNQPLHDATVPAGRDPP